MMKKILAALLCALLLTGVALAEETASVTAAEGFDISVVVPEGYTFSENYFHDKLYAELDPTDAARATMTFSVGYSAEYDGVTLNELSEEEVNALIAVCVEDFAYPTWAVSETEKGTKIIVIDENSDVDEYAEIFTIYKGYFVQVLIEPGETQDGQLTDDDLALAVKFLSDMEFVVAE